MLDDRAAAAAAAALLDEHVRKNFNRHSRNEVRVAPEHGFKDGRYFIIPYNSVDLLDHGDLDAELAGNFAILVDLESGACRFLTVAEELDYRSRGFPI